MKSNYYIRRINSPFDDSSVFVRNVYMKKAVLFDCGRLGNIENSEIADVTTVFISHTHIDHFIGFDRFLRGSLLSNNVVKIFGPRGIINNVKGKLSGYTWNLIQDYELSFHVFELTDDGIYSSLFSSKNFFNEERLGRYEEKLMLDDDFSVEYDFFDHGIPSVGYRLKEPVRISINKDKMKAEKILSGQWIKDFKNIVLCNDKSNNEILVDTVDGQKKYYINELTEKIVEFPKPQDITYITDIAPSYENYKKAVKLSYESFLLIIEAVFLQQDIEHADAKKHLNINLSKGIFKESLSEYVSFGHFAPKYDRQREEFFKELYAGINISKIIKNELIR